VGILALWLGLACTCLAAEDSTLEAARGAAKWLETAEVPKSDNNLYDGASGPVLFFLEMFRYTGGQNYLKSARARADALLSSIATEEGNGLYEGLAGVGFTLGEAYLVTKDAKYRDGAMRCVELLHERAQSAGRGIQWNDTTDVIAGGSGIGLFLLWADEQLHVPAARQTAIGAGERLLELAQPAGRGQLKWMMDSKFPREMPNFSHGTAGVAYFLATLYEKTHQRKFLDAAVAGANYLLAIADTQGDACILYHDNENKKLYYLSWCHGPAGTARLFYRLYQATKDPSWLEWMKKSANALVASGAPDRVVTPGDWNNISVCCGVTGQAQFFLDVYQVTGDRKYLDLAARASALLVSKATQDKAGTRWVQAEHRVRPELEIAQAGYMQGASGVGMWLLHFSGFLSHSDKPVIAFPDNPFVY
jgi:lantibiotic modifying enzyme